MGLALDRRVGRPEIASLDAGQDGQKCTVFGRDGKKRITILGGIESW